MDTLWSELTIDGIKVEESEMSQENFERLLQEWREKCSSTAAPKVDTVMQPV